MLKRFHSSIGRAADSKSGRLGVQVPLGAPVLKENIWLNLLHHQKRFRKKDKEIPSFVINAFNILIIKNLHNGEAIIIQDEVIAKILQLHDTTRERIFENRWLDVESTFRAYGWNVEYDKHGYNESHNAIFKFTSA